MTNDFILPTIEELGENERKRYQERVEKLANALEISLPQARKKLNAEAANK